MNQVVILIIYLCYVRSSYIVPIYLKQSYDILTPKVDLLYTYCTKKTNYNTCTILLPNSVPNTQLVSAANAPNAANKMAR